METKIVALGYARKSPDDPDSTESSISNQIKLIEDTCKKFGWILKSENIILKSSRFSGGIVLDPFSGGGTTCYVAKHLLRNYIGIEINPTYIKEIQKSKLAQEVLKL